MSMRGPLPIHLIRLPIGLMARAKVHRSSICLGARATSPLDPPVENGKHHKRQQGGTDQSADDHNGEGALHFGADASGKRQRDQPE